MSTISVTDNTNNNTNNTKNNSNKNDEFAIIHPDTQLLMYDGTVKSANSITTEDVLMGDDSSPRNIISVSDDEQDMFKIVPIKGDPFIVGRNHKLALKLSKNASAVWRPDRNYYDVRYCNSSGQMKTETVKIKKGNTKEQTEIEANEIRDRFIEESKDMVIDVPVSNYIMENKTWKTHWKIYRTSIDFNSIEKLDIDPYLIGLWLGDGTSSASEITNIDKNILDYLKKTLPGMDMELIRRTLNGEDTITYYMRGNGFRNNMFLNELKNTNMLNNKHIPLKYKRSSEENRLKLLAGIIDTDGSLANKVCYDIIQKSTILAKDIEFVARSCGFAAYSTKCKKGCMYKGEYKEGEYNRMTISGETDNVPVILERKKANKRTVDKSVLNTGFSVETLGQIPCKKIKLDEKNGKRFVLADFTVTN